MSKDRDRRERWSAKRRDGTILGLLRGEDIETLSREPDVTAAPLRVWGDQFLAGGEGNLKARKTDTENEETQRLKSLVADLGMPEARSPVASVRTRDYRLSDC